MDLHKKLSVFHYFHSIALILLLTFAATFGALSFYNAKAKYEKESVQLQEAYLDSKKKMLITEVDRFVQQIEEKRQYSYAKTQQLVKARVYEAHDVASKLYEKYKKNSHRRSNKIDNY